MGADMLTPYEFQPTSLFIRNQPTPIYGKLGGAISGGNVCLPTGNLWLLDFVMHRMGLEVFGVSAGLFGWGCKKRARATGLGPRTGISNQEIHF